jgi:TolB-like protein/Tfp pilus assembly protein PilF
MIGKTVSHYKITEKLGQGGMGVVYRARDTRLDRDVALKFLSDSVTADAELKERFKREARATASISDPHIATIHAIEEVDGQLFLVLEYVEGNDLRTFTASNTVSVEDAIEFTRQMAAALAAAHEKGVIHRDVKSANVMINDSGRVKMMDFGLALARGTTQITQAGTVMGTLAYMSPEQIQGREVDARSDLWSLGVVLYEILVGALPFQAENDAALIYAVLNEAPPTVDSVRPEVPAHVAGLINRLLSKDPDKRPGSAREVMDTLSESAIHRAESAAVPTDQRSIAVLFFENMSADAENDYFCAGITEDLIIDLSRIADLKVIPRADVVPYRGKDMNRQEIGRRLGVAYVLEGSVRKAAQKVRITTQLIDTATGYPEWSERYDRQLEDIFEIQADVSERIVEAMKVSLSPKEKESLGERGGHDLKAYDLFMRGRDFLNRGGGANNKSGMQMIEHAVALDPGLAQGWVALGEAYEYRYYFYDGGSIWKSKAINAYEKALAADPDMIEARLGIGFSLTLQRRLEESLKAYEAVLAERPRFYLALRWACVTNTNLNRHDEAIDYAMQMAEVKPYSEEPWVHVSVAAAKKGDMELAQRARREQLERGLTKMEVDPEDFLALSRIATAYASIGEPEKARAAIDRILDADPDDGIVVYNTACASALLGDRDRMLELLRRALALGFTNTLAWVKGDPDFKDYHDDPDFKAIVNAPRE